MSWRSYDQIADVYDHIWGARFEAVARAMAGMVSGYPSGMLLDIGTGTGIVPAIFSAALKTNVSVGCDLSIAMLRQARIRLPGLHVVAADATALPFKSSIAGGGVGVTRWTALCTPMCRKRCAVSGHQFDYTASRCRTE